MHLHISVLYVHMCVCVCVLMYVWTLVNCWKQKWNGDKGKMAISINSSSASEGDARDLKKSTHLSAAGGKEWEGRDRDRRREREREREGEGESAVVDIAVLVLLLLLSSIFTLVASYQMAAAQLTFLTFVYTLSTADFVVPAAAVVVFVVIAADLCTICVLYVAVAFAFCTRRPPLCRFDFLLCDRCVLF